MRVVPGFSVFCFGFGFSEVMIMGVFLSSFFFAVLYFVQARHTVAGFLFVRGDYRAGESCLLF